MFADWLDTGLGQLDGKLYEYSSQSYVTRGVLYLSRVVHSVDSTHLRDPALPLFKDNSCFLDFQTGSIISTFPVMLPIYPNSTPSYREVVTTLARLTITIIRHPTTSPHLPCYSLFPATTKLIRNRLVYTPDCRHRCAVHHFPSRGHCITDTSIVR